MAKDNIGKITLLGARLSFAALFQPDEQRQDDGTMRETWKGNFLFPKDDLENCLAIYKGVKMPVREAVNKAFQDVKAEKWGPKEKQPKLRPEKLCWRDGDLEDWDGYPGCFYISSSSAPKKGQPIMTARPAVVTNRRDGNNNWIEAQPGGQASPYSGCYVNSVIEVWAQDNEHGKRLNARLKSVQFFKDGEAFGAAPSNPNEDFTDDMAGSTGSYDGDDGDSDDDMI